MGGRHHTYLIFKADYESAHRKQIQISDKCRYIIIFWFVGNVIFGSIQANQLVLIFVFFYLVIISYDTAWYIV